jgi:DNA-binding NarL/FixJ family response regulator
MNVRILLVDDHKMMRDGLRTILERRSDFEVVGEAEDGHAAIALVPQVTPDVIVMDVGMPRMNGIEATRRIRRESPDARVVALSTHSDKRYVQNMITAGAAGYVLKEAASDDLLRAVDAVARGEHYLSPQITGVMFDTLRGRVSQDTTPAYALLGTREREVLQLLAEGLTSKEIAKRLNLSTKTVETHRRNISQKLDLHSIAVLTKFAVREGLTTLE